jgi:hypothetical protein
VTIFTVIHSFNPHHLATLNASVNMESQYLRSDMNSGELSVYGYWDCIYTNTYFCQCIPSYSDLTMLNYLCCCTTICSSWCCHHHYCSKHSSVRASFKRKIKPVHSIPNRKETHCLFLCMDQLFIIFLLALQNCQRC